MGEDDKPLRVSRQAWKDYVALPDDVKRVFGFALRRFQEGRMPENAEQMRHLGQPPIHEVSDDYEGNVTYRMMVVLLDTGVFLIHAFKKKSTEGIATPLRHIETAKRRRTRAIAYDAALKVGESPSSDFDTISRVR